MATKKTPIKKSTTKAKLQAKSLESPKMGGKPRGRPRKSCVTSGQGANRNALAREWPLLADLIG